MQSLTWQTIAWTGMRVPLQQSDPNAIGHRCTGSVAWTGSDAAAIGHNRMCMLPVVHENHIDRRITCGAPMSMRCAVDEHEMCSCLHACGFAWANSDTWRDKKQQQCVVAIVAIKWKCLCRIESIDSSKNYDWSISNFKIGAKRKNLFGLLEAHIADYYQVRYYVLLWAYGHIFSIYSV